MQRPEQRCIFGSAAFLRLLRSLTTWTSAPVFTSTTLDHRQFFERF